MRIKNCGINRISIGVQQLNEDLIQYSGRIQKKSHLLDILECCKELKIDTSIDLIFGWPKQTKETMLADLEELVKLNIKHITHYELNIGGKHCPSYFAQNLHEIIPSIDETLELYSIARDFLLSNNYRQITCYDFQKLEDGNVDSFTFEKNARNAITFDRRSILYPDHPGRSCR